jgi:hypothetical protein
MIYRRTTSMSGMDEVSGRKHEVRKHVERGTASYDSLSRFSPAGFKAVPGIGSMNGTALAAVERCYFVRWKSIFDRKPLLFRRDRSL